MHFTILSLIMIIIIGNMIDCGNDNSDYNGDSITNDNNDNIIQIMI